MLNSYGMLNRRLTREAQQAIRFIFFKLGFISIA